jgi:hypothetical protein
MALWGNNDAIGAGGTVTLGYAGGEWIVTGTGTTFGNVGAAGTGDIIRFGDRAGTYYGDAVIVGIASTTQVTIGSTAGLSQVAFAATTFTVSQLPKYTVLDSHYSEVNSTYDSFVYGVSSDEAQASTYTEYSPTHAGWVGITTYLDSDGNLRTKSEVLVAMSSIINDAADDAVFPDRVISIVSQPSSASVGTTATARFYVTATAAPTGTLSYQWEYSTTGVAYTSLSNDSTYSGTTTAGLAVTNTDSSLNGFRFRVVISATDATDVTSNAAVMTVS